MNNAQGRLEMGENIVQKAIDKIRALKENQDKLIKGYFRFPRDLSNVNKENTGVTSMVDFVTLTNEKRAKTWIIWTPKNKTGKNWANVAKSLNKKIKKPWQCRETKESSNQVRQNKRTQFNGRGPEQVFLPKGQLNSAKKTVNKSNHLQCPSGSLGFYFCQVSLYHAIPPSGRDETMRQEK